MNNFNRISIFDFSLNSIRIISDWKLETEIKVSQIIENIHIKIMMIIIERLK